MSKFDFVFRLKMIYLESRFQIYICLNFIEFFKMIYHNSNGGWLLIKKNEKAIQKIRKLTYFMNKN